MTDEDGSCDFCSIARGEDDAAEIVAQGDDWIAFFPLEPATPGHSLIIPREHVRDLWTLSPSMGSALMSAVITVGQAIDRALHPDGMNLISSAGRAAEQSVFHLHMHVVPRWRNDGFGEIWPTGSRYESAELDDVGELIRIELQRTL
ncbi:MAG: HIT family protein [Solirubrobacterales bacterium]